MNTRRRRGSARSEARIFAEVASSTWSASGGPSGIKDHHPTYIVAREYRSQPASAEPLPLANGLHRVLGLALAESHATGGAAIDPADLPDGELFGPLRPGLAELRDAVTRPSPFGERLGKAAREGELPPGLNRDGVIDRVVQIRSLRSKNNPVLVASPTAKFPPAFRIASSS